MRKLTKKLISLLLCFVCVFSMVACNKDTGNDEKTPTKGAEKPVELTPTAVPEVTLTPTPVPTEEPTPTQEPASEAAIAVANSIVELCYESASEEQTCKPLFWKVTDPDGEGVLYMLGSFHLVDGRAYQAHEKILDAYVKSDSVALEFDMLPYLSDADKQLEMTMAYVNEGMATIDTIIGEELYESLKELLTEYGVYQVGLEYYSPYYWSSAVSTIIYSLAGLSATSGYDLYFDSMAYLQGKPVRSIESMESQTELLLSADKDLYIAELKAALEDGYIEENVELAKQLYEAWLSGDIDTLTKMVREDYEGEDLKDEDPALQEKLMEFNRKMYDDRNKAMTDAYMSYIEEGETTFAIVGTAHYLGEPGILNELAKYGYVIEQIVLD